MTYASAKVNKAASCVPKPKMNCLPKGTTYPNSYWPSTMPNSRNPNVSPKRRPSWSRSPNRPSGNTNSVLWIQNLRNTSNCRSHWTECTQSSTKRYRHWIKIRTKWRQHARLPKNNSWTRKRKWRQLKQRFRLYEGRLSN